MLSPVQDRAHGAFLGLAVGDALGATLEFEERDELPHHTEMLGGGPFNLKPGQWTDDTSMALALAESLIAHPEFDATDLMRRFVAWAEDGAYSCTGHCFDIGIITRNSLGYFQRTGDPFAGSPAPDRAGNGSLMRVAPVAIRALNDAHSADELARQQSRTTHGATQAVEACSYFVQLLREAILGEADVLRPRSWIGDGMNGLRPRVWIEGHDGELSEKVWDGDPAIQEISTGSWRGKTRQQIRSSGYVIHTLEAALWAVGTTTSFEEALIRAVNLAGDADTVGAVTGQLAGALYGASAIPQRWLEPLAWRDQLEALAAQLLHLARPLRAEGASLSGPGPEE